MQMTEHPQKKKYIYICVNNCLTCHRLIKYSFEELNQTTLAGFHVKKDLFAFLKTPKRKNKEIKSKGPTVQLANQVRALYMRVTAD